MKKNELDVENAVEIQNTKLPNLSVRCWHSFENYVWMSDHHFFYICCIHEYCWNKCIKNDKSLIAIRAFLLLTMIGLVAAEVYTERHFRFLYFANIGVYLTTIVTFIQLTCAIKYTRQLNGFNLQLKSLQENFISRNKGEEEKDDLAS